jgi:hypothetical protein
MLSLLQSAPVASDLSTLSLPARSTKCRQLQLTLPDMSFPFTWTVKILQENIEKSVAANTERTSNKNEHWVDNMDAYL